MINMAPSSTEYSTIAKTTVKKIGRVKTNSISKAPAWRNLGLLFMAYPIPGAGLIKKGYPEYYLITLPLTNVIITIIDAKKTGAAFRQPPLKHYEEILQLL